MTITFETFILALVGLAALGVFTLFMLLVATAVRALWRNLTGSKPIDW